MDLNVFGSSSPGSLIPIQGIDPRAGEWNHRAFLPDPLETGAPSLTPQTYNVLLKARAALSALDATAQQLPNPTLLRIPTLRKEAQSTSALEGTYAPLAEVLTADEESILAPAMTEVLNYVRMANSGFAKISEGYPISVPLINDLQGTLMRGTSLEKLSGSVRTKQVVIGRRDDASKDELPIHASRFVPAPPGPSLEMGLRDLVDWINVDSSKDIDPLIATALAHYQFETLHPYMDGNGRVGRYLIVLHLHQTGILSEPTLTVSPWFEARRTEYYDRLFAVSASGDWDGFIRFFAEGLGSAAEQTKNQMLDLVEVQAELRDRLRASNLRADTAHALVDLAVANPSFSIKKVASDLEISYGRANKLVGQLVELGILAVVDESAYKRIFYSPSVLEVLIGSQ